VSVLCIPGSPYGTLVFYYTVYLFLYSRYARSVCRGNHLHGLKVCMRKGTVQFVFHTVEHQEENSLFWQKSIMQSR
jgi:hypothetical protein